MRFFAFFMCVLALVGCSEDDPVDAVQDAGAPEVAPQRGVSADWLNHTLSIVDLNALEKGGTRADALLETIDLADYAAGPLVVEVTPDGKTALVSLSAGFFSLPFAGSLIGATDIPTDTGRLLFVDLETMKVLGELDTGKHPMGIAITPDGTRAFVAHFGSNHVAVVDIAKRALIDQVEVGIYSEEITLDDTGSVGIFSYSAAGNFRTFATDDMAGTLSDDVELSGDAAGVAFFPGTKLAYMVQAPMPLTSQLGGHTIADVSDPQAPVVLEDVHETTAPIAYPAVAVPARKSVVVPINVRNVLSLQEIELSADNEKKIVQTIEVGPSVTFGAYSASVDARGRVLLSVPREHFIAVVDLEKGKAFTVDWGVEQAGPMDIALIP